MVSHSLFTTLCLCCLRSIVSSLHADSLVECRIIGALSSPAAVLFLNQTICRTFAEDCEYQRAAGSVVSRWGGVIAGHKRWAYNIRADLANTSADGVPRICFKVLRQGIVWVRAPRKKKKTWPMLEIMCDVVSRPCRSGQPKAEKPIQTQFQTPPDGWIVADFQPSSLTSSPSTSTTMTPSTIGEAEKPVNWLFFHPVNGLSEAQRITASPDAVIQESDWAAGLKRFFNFRADKVYFWLVTRRPSSFLI